MVDADANGRGRETKHCGACREERWKRKTRWNDCELASGLVGARESVCGGCSCRGERGSKSSAGCRAVRLNERAPTTQCVWLQRRVANHDPSTASACGSPGLVNPPDQPAKARSCAHEATRDYGSENNHSEVECGFAIRLIDNG